MKYLIIVFLSCISLACAYEVHLRNGIKPKKFPSITLDQNIIPKKEWNELKSLVENGNSTLRAGSVQADVTDYARAILANVANLIIHAGFDPMQLSDEHLSLFPGTLDLTNGWLQELSSITVSDEVIAKYTRSTHILELTLPLAFDAILVDYNYHVQVILLGLSGTIDAKISNLKINLHMGFNFTEYHAFVDEIDVKDSGSIDIKFTGLGLLDWLIDIMTNSLTTLFHRLIFSVVNAVIYNPVQDVVNSINGIIDSILHPNSTSIMFN